MQDDAIDAAPRRSSRLQAQATSTSSIAGSSSVEDASDESVAWGSESTMRQPAIDDKIELWLPMGTRNGERRLWVARFADSGSWLPDRVEFTSPYWTSGKCRERGQWLLVKLGHGGILQTARYDDTGANFRIDGPVLEQDQLPPHLRGNPPYAGAARGAPPAPLDRKVSLHVYAPNRAKYARIEEHGGSRRVDLAHVHGNYWCTRTPLPCGPKGFGYTVCVGLPSTIVSAITYAERGVVHSVPPRTHASPPVEVIIDLGDMHGDNDKTRVARARLMLISLVQHVATLARDDGAVRRISEVLRKLIRTDRIDFSNTVNWLIEHETLIGTQLQLVLCIAGTGSTPRIDINHLCRLLGGNTPMRPLDFAVNAMQELVRTFPGPLWVALLRWGLTPQALSVVRPRPIQPEDFVLLLKGVSRWLGTQPASGQWRERGTLIVLLCKLVGTVPEVHSLLALLSVEWPIGPPHCPPSTRAGSSAQPPLLARSVSTETAESISELRLSPMMSIVQIIAAPELPSPQKHQLRLALEETWARCLEPYRLSELLGIFADHPQIGHLLREAATRVACWDGTVDNQLAVLGALGFGQDKLRSEALVRNLLNSRELHNVGVSLGSTSMFGRFPELLALLAPSGLKQPELTTKFIAALVQSVKQECASASERERASEAAARLYLFVADSWPAWTAPPLLMGFETLRVEVVQLHRKPGGGGGMTLLEATRRVGERVAGFGDTPVFTEWLLPAIRTYFEERLLDKSGALQSVRSAALSSGERAHEMLVELTRRRPDGGLVVANSLCATVLQCLLGVLDPVVPRDDAPLLRQLLTRDQTSFWPIVLRITGHAETRTSAPALVLEQGTGAARVVRRVREVIDALSESLLNRSIGLRRAFKLLSESMKDRHSTLLLYTTARGVTSLSADELDRVRNMVLDLRAVIEALEHFRIELCHGSPDFDALTDEIRRVQQAERDDEPLRDALDEGFWGHLLTPQMRDVAATTHRLRQSLLFRQEWERAKKAMAGGMADDRMAEDTGGEDQEPALPIATLVNEVHEMAITTFQTNCKRMLDMEKPIAIHEVAHILGTPLEQADADHLEASLPQELRLMFAGEPTREEGVAMHELLGQLKYYARMRKTLNDASAIDGLVANVLAPRGGDASDAEGDGAAVQTLSAELMKLGKVDENRHFCSRNSLRQLATTSETFYTMLVPQHKEALDAADQVGAERARELLAFVRFLEDHELRDLVDSGGDDKADVIDAITSLGRVAAVLQPLLRAPPTSLMGTAESVLEVLGASLAKIGMSGIELAGHVETCAANLHALTHRNKGMGDQAKDNIREIAEQGTFVFREGQLEVCCSGGARFTAAKMSDLRSHALLGLDAQHRELAAADASSDGAAMDAEDAARGRERESTEHFLNLLAASEGICASLAELRMLGFFGVYDLSLAVKELEELQSAQHGLARACVEWRSAIRKAREQQYMLAFFASRQLWVLHAWLCGPEGSHERDRTAPLCPSLLGYVPAMALHPAGPAAADRMGSSNAADDSVDLCTPPSTPEREEDFITTNAAVNIERAVEQLHALGAALEAHFCGATPQRRVSAGSGWSRKEPLVGTGSICFIRGAQVLESCLALYAADGALPAHSQLLLCSADTTYEEVEAFLHRAFHADVSPLMRGRLFCALRLGGLTESLYLHFKERLERLHASVHPRRVRLALLSDEREQHRVSSDLVAIVHQIEPPALSRAAVEEALRGERFVQMVTSERAGLGKTRTVHATAAQRKCRHLRTVAISGHMSRGEMVEMLLSVMTAGGGEVDALHLNILDVPASCAEVVNDVLFELLCLHMIGSSAAAMVSLVAVPSTVIFIEIANTVGTDELLQRLPICSYLRGESQLHLRWDAASNPYVLSPTAPNEAQLVCCYLQALDSGSIGGHVDVQPLTGAQCWALLERHFIARLAAEGQPPSFAQLDVFVAVLSEQLQRFQSSGALLPDTLREFGHPNVRAVVARCLVDAAARFAMRTVTDGGRAAGAGENEAARVARLLTPQSFESVNYMLLLMQKEVAITVFPGPTEFGRSAMEVKRYYDDQQRLFPGQGSTLPEWKQIAELAPAGQRGGTDLLDEMINFLGVESRRAHLRANFKACRYTLTADNCLKMMLVHVRISAGQPVVVSGETGCGKTSLIKFLLYLLGMPHENFCVLNVHAGVGGARITDFVNACEAVARRSDREVWVFFDEANTSPHLATISELMCRRTLNGKRVAPTLRFLAAVNPHRLRTKEVESVGLQSKLNTEDPMRRLVYRVYRLPQALCDFVWDYGQLAQNDERDYISNMLSDSLIPPLEARLVFESQAFIRREEEDCSVSLRDVRRYKKLVSWFLSTQRARSNSEKAAGAQPENWWQSGLQWIDPRRYLSGGGGNGQKKRDEKEIAVVLALAHVYYCRLPTRQKRERYVQLVDRIWQSVYQSHRGYEYQNRFKELVEAEQRRYVERMEVPPHLGAVAMNRALLENVFVLLVCIVNRMPVLLVGKPGCSKTLAMQLIIENLRGKDSRFPELPCVYELRYQCSEDSTSEGIEAIFDSARRKASNDGDTTYVVVLDEIGLAEVSQHNPLKVLHDRLEPDSRQEFDDVDAGRDGHDLPYAVVGISNWALDSSKMNRMINLSRPDPDCPDLEETANAIVERMGGRGGREIGKNHRFVLSAVSKAYFAFKQPSDRYVMQVRRAMIERGLLRACTHGPEYVSQQQHLTKMIANFHGLRDFYALDRTIGAMPNPEPELVATAVARNFNGLPGSAARFQRLLDEQTTYAVPTASVSPISLICDNLRDPRARHLMLISRGDAATCLLRLPQIKEALHSPILMLASRFKEDCGTTYDYQQLSRISQHMMAGRQLIIKDFDSIYGALYDPLNQSYLVHKKRKCRVALENASKQVEVHEDFRMIMIEEERDLQHSDPPRLNRCEKQSLTYIDVLQELGTKLSINCEQLLGELQTYCKQLATFDSEALAAARAPDQRVMKTPGDAPVVLDALTARDAFLGLTEDALPSLLVREMQAATARVNGSSDSLVADIRRRCKATLHDLMPADAVVRCEFSRFAQNPDNEEELRELTRAHEASTHHAGLRECFEHAWPRLLRLQDDDAESANGVGVMEMDVDTDGSLSQQEQPCLLILTFTNYTCSIESILAGRGVATTNMKLLRIGAFESEKTLRAEVDGFWREAEPRDMLVIQCDVALHAQHLLLTREIMREAELAYTNVAVAARRPKAQAIVLHLTRFQSAAVAGRWEFSHMSEWKQIMVDRLECEASDLRILRAARTTRDAACLLTGATAVAGEIGEPTHASSPLPLPSLSALIRSELPWALRRLAYPHREPRVTLDYVKRMAQELLTNPRVLARLEQRIYDKLRAGSAQKPLGHWLPLLAHDLGALIKAGSLTALIREELVKSVRYPLALLLHQLERHSALAGLRSCRSAAQKAMWLSVYLPEDATSAALGEPTQRQLQPLDKDWGLECLPLHLHHTRLRWAYSGEFERRLRDRKPQFVEICAPAWSTERIASMRQGVCLHFVAEDPLLRRIAMVAAARGQEEEGLVVTDEDASRRADDIELARALETLWVDERERFREDVQDMIAAELASRDVGISADRIATLVGAALLPAHAQSDEWHPADICIQHWRCEPILRHALQLFLLVDGRFDPSGQANFALELADRAASSCLAKAHELATVDTPAQRAAEWLGVARRCLNYAQKMEQDDNGLQLGCQSLQHLRLCADFCARVVLPNAAAIEPLVQALVQMATSDELARDLLVRVMSTLLNDLAACGDDDAAAKAAATSVDEFKFVWVVRELQAALSANDERAADGATAALGAFLGHQRDAGDWVAGEVPPIVGQAMQMALEALGLIGSYELRRGDAHCFGSLTATIDASMRASDGALAALVCSLLQMQFARDIWLSLDEGAAPARMLAGPSSSPTHEGVAPKRPRLAHDASESFKDALGNVATKLYSAAPQASALYHLAYVKAFVQVACRAILDWQRNASHNVQPLLTVLDGAMRGPSEQEPAASLQVYVLKELRSAYSLDQIMQGFRSGELGNLLPALKSRCTSSVALPTASKLGFDPFAPYGGSYRSARRTLQLSIDGQAPQDGVESDPPLTLFAVAAALYLPRSLHASVTIEQAEQGAARCISTAERRSPVARLAGALASNRPEQAQMVLTPQTERVAVFACSLAVHLAAVLDATDPATNPLALYAKQPAGASHLFVLCVPSNEMAMAMRAASIAGSGQANAPIRCACGFMYVIGNCGGAVTIGQCPQCKTEIGGRDYGLAAGQQAIADRNFGNDDEPGFIADDDAAYGAFHVARDLPALAYRTLHLLTHLSLFCGPLLGHSGLDVLVTGQGDSSAYCWAAALRDLHLIQPLLGHVSEEETCAWLHDAIQRLPAWCAGLGAARNTLHSAEARRQWERDFATQFIRPLEGTAHTCLAARPLGDGPRPMLHRLVDEDEGLNVEHRALWSKVEQPTVEGLRAAFERLGADGRGRYPLLALCLDRVELLELAQHLWPFVQWERLLREQWGARLERTSALEMTVGQLLEQTSDESLRHRAFDTFDAFARAWNAVVALLRRGQTEASTRYADLTDCHPVEPAAMMHMDISAKLVLACIDPQICAEPVGNLFRLFLRLLATAQNDFLAAVVPMVPGCNALVALSLGGNAVWLDTAPQTALLQLQRQHVLLEDASELRAQMLRGCLAQAGYRVSGMSADFAFIEQGIATRLLTGARHVDTEADAMGEKQAPSIFVFAGELLLRHRNLPRLVSEQMVQEPVANARALRGEPFLQETSQCRATLELLESVLYHSTKSLPAPDEPLASYCRAFDVAGTADSGGSNLRGRVLQCVAIASVPLKQLRALYELVEDLVADAVLPTLSKSLPQHYREPLPSVALADRACLALGRHAVGGGASDAAAMRAGLLRFEPALKRFIYRELTASALINEGTLSSPLYYFVLREDFPWTMGDAVTDEEIEAALDDGGVPALKHALELWLELQRRGDGGEWVVV